MFLSSTLLTFNIYWDLCRSFSAFSSAFLCFSSASFLFFSASFCFFSATAANSSAFFRSSSSFLRCSCSCFIKSSSYFSFSFRIFWPISFLTLNNVFIIGSTMDIINSIRSSAKKSCLLEVAISGKSSSSKISNEISPST